VKFNNNKKLEMKSIAKEPMNSFGSGDGGNIVPYSGSPSSHRIKIITTMDILKHFWK
jgi:hypothetical protein